MAAVTSTQARAATVVSGKKQKGPFNPTAIIVNGTLLMLVIAWLLPTIGLIITSVRTRQEIATSGWWTVFPHQEYVSDPAAAFPAPKGQSSDAPITVTTPDGATATATFAQFRQGVTASDGSHLLWVGNLRLGTIQVQKLEWQWGSEWTLQNYAQVLLGVPFQVKQADGTVQTIPGNDMTSSFINSLIVTIPATVIPILIAAFAAYGFAWMKFPGRKFFFIMVVALLVVPLQIALVPILTDYVKLHLNGTFLGIWLVHTGFGLSLATYLLYGYISQLPRDILESAFIDGASHFTIFTRLILPLSMPALASFAIFQFLWVWNDYLVALVFLGAQPNVQVLTLRLGDMVGSRNSEWYILTAGAFVSMLVPLIVFFSLQRYFVRGLLAGSVKG